jgi:hypothetical protein
MFSSIAREPLPETGRSSASGMISGGIPRNFAAGATAPTRISSKPDALSIDTAVISATSEGSTLTHVDMPSAAPAKNSSKTATRLAAAKTSTRKTNAGAAETDSHPAAFMP